jgi:hypothetical protein
VSSPTQDRLYEMFLAIAGTKMVDKPGGMLPPDEVARLGSATSVVTEAASEALSGLAAKSPIRGATDEAAVVTGVRPAQTTESAATTTTGTSSAISSDGALTNVTGLISNLLGGIPLVSTATQAASAGGSAGSVLESLASDVLKSGLGMLPLIGGLIGLFGGSDNPAPTPLVKYALPTALAFQGAESANGIGGGDYDQNGMPRAYQWNAGFASTEGSLPSIGNGFLSSGSSQPSLSSAPQITVNVQAMDARSFLDRSSDIAAAVREAMLNLNSINDVVNDL